MNDLPQFLRDMLSSPPKHGQGVHNWLFRVARHLHAHRNKDDIFALLKASLIDCGRNVPEREIQDAINNSEANAWRPGFEKNGDWKEPDKRRPEFNETRWRTVIAATPFSLADWLERSPIRCNDEGSPTESILPKLFPRNPLVCVAWEKNRAITKDLLELAGELDSMQFIVPNAMAKPVGRTQNGRESVRCLDNTGPRQFLVIELDRGTIDEQSSVLEHLMQRYRLLERLTLIVFSGGKSLHAWIQARELAEKNLKILIDYAASLGADPQMLVRCQFARMPGGRRDNGKRQEVYYWNPAALDARNEPDFSVPPSPEPETQPRVESAQPNGDTQDEPLEEFNQYPVALPDAFYGITGRITRIIEPETEADPIAIQMQLLAAAGCAIGHGPHFMVGATAHHANIFSCLVGRTSKGRKGSALDFVVWVMKEVDCPWVGTCLTSGLSSGEGLIYAVRDQLIKKEQVKQKGKYTGDVQEYIADYGIEDKRLFVTESEFSRPLKAMSRESNILSEVLRSAWDHGNLRSMVKNNPYHASNAHISIIGHITREELAKSLLECNFFNGFSNRFLWLCVQRSKILPFGGDLSLSDLYPEIDEFKAAVEWARDIEEMERDGKANELWESVYGELTADMPGRFGATIGRGEGQVLRLSMIYALLDKSQTIKAVHLQAALALWKYCVDSARYLFLGSFDNPHAERIFKALSQRPLGMTRAEINVEVFQRHLPKPKMSDALNYLRRLSLARSELEHTKGRSTEHWFATIRKPGIEEYD